MEPTGCPEMKIKIGIYGAANPRQLMIGTLQAINTVL
jgi:hypothetical protein